jgi:hypothetical protein
MAASVFLLYSVLSFLITLSTIYAALKYSPYSRNKWLLKTAGIAEGLVLIVSLMNFVNDWASKVALILFAISPIFPVLYGFSSVIEIAEKMEFRGILLNDFARKRVHWARILYFGVILSAALIQFIDSIVSVSLIAIFTLLSHILALQALNVIHEKPQAPFMIERIRKSVWFSLILVIIAVILLILFFVNSKSVAHHEYDVVSLIIIFPIFIILIILRTFITAFTGFLFYDSCCPNEKIRRDQLADYDIDEEDHSRGEEYF